MRRILSCFAAYGSGGLGQHFTQVIEEARAQQQLFCYYSLGEREGDVACRQVSSPLLSNWLPYSPWRYSPGWINYLSCDLFDRAVAQRLPPAAAFQGFVGQSLHCFRQLQRHGLPTLYLEAANSHVNNVLRQHQQAIADYGIEPGWLNQAQYRKTLREYELADVIYVTSEYTRQTFLAAGVPAHKLVRRRLQVHPRFQPPQTRPADGVFRIVYCGNLTATKGIPVLLEAFSHLPRKDVELTLVGTWATRGMRRYLESWLHRDGRIRIVAGDPLPYLQQANVYVHPSYEDGFAYAAAEALACGVPVIVTEHTGMKELVQEGINGYVIPTGDWKALLEQLAACQKKLL